MVISDCIFLALALESAVSPVNLLVENDIWKLESYC